MEGTYKEVRKLLIRQNPSGFFLLTFLALLLYPLGAAAQFPVTVDANNNDITVQIGASVPADATSASLVMTIFDPDQTNEGQLFINGNGPIDLFNGAELEFANKNNLGQNNDQVVSVTARIPIAWVVNGQNALRFTHVATQGYRVDGANFIAGNIPISRIPEIMPNMAGGDPSPNRQKALTLYKRLTGTTTPIDNPVLIEMESMIAANNMVAAAKKATEDTAFYNVVVRDFAAKMSTRDETVKAPLSDFVATVMGVAYDQGDARTLLTGNFTYRSSFSGRQSVENDIIKSNAHYLDLVDSGYDIVRTLQRKDGIDTLDSNGNTVTLQSREAAGLLSTRAWAEAHLVAGTNRRPVEFAFREFLCVPIEHWADTSLSDAYIRRDVDRFPGDDNGTFQSTCSACHRPLDAMTPAFARFDFDSGFLKNARLFANGVVDFDTDTDDSTMKQNPPGISAKMNVNGDVYSSGYVVQNDSWRNLASVGSNAVQFGWRGKLQGSSLRDFGEMVANAQAFKSCMATRVFETLCKRSPASFDVPMIQWAAQEFERDGYNLKNLFERIAVRPECIGF